MFGWLSEATTNPPAIDGPEDAYLNNVSVNNETTTLNDNGSDFYVWGNELTSNLNDVFVTNATATYNHNGSVSYMRKNELTTNTIHNVLYILSAVGCVIIMYMLFKSVILRRRQCRVRKHKVIASREDMETTPLESDDDESTVFDVRSAKNLSR